MQVLENPWTPWTPRSHVHSEIVLFKVVLLLFIAAATASASDAIPLRSVLSYPILLYHGWCLLKVYSLLAPYPELLETVTLDKALQFVNRLTKRAK